MSRENVAIVGMLSSRGMARSNITAVLDGRRTVRRIQVYSPTKANREAYATEIAEQYGLEVVPMDHPSEIFKGADIVAGCTDSAIPLPMGDWLEPGTHVVSIGGRPDDAAYHRFDVYLRFGTAPTPRGLPQWQASGEGVAYHAQPDNPLYQNQSLMGRSGRGERTQPQKTRFITLEEMLSGGAPGRESDKQITFSDRGNIQGAQFWAVAGKVYEAAKAEGLGHGLPTEWFLQDSR